MNMYILLCAEWNSKRWESARDGKVPEVGKYQVEAGLDARDRTVLGSNQAQLEAGGGPSDGRGPVSHRIPEQQQLALYVPAYM